MVAVAEGYDDARRILHVIAPDAAIISATKVEGRVEEFLTWLDGDSGAGGIPTLLVAPSKSQAILADIAAGRRSRRGYLSWPLKCGDLQLIMQDLLRTDTPRMEPVSSGQVVLDPRLRLMQGQAGTTVLTPAEFRLAEYLMIRGGRVVDVEEVLTRVFGLYSGHANPAFVRAHARSLREKVRIVTGGSESIRAVGRRGFVYLGG